MVLGLLAEREALAARALAPRASISTCWAPPSPRSLEPQGGPLPEHIPFSPAAKRTLELTLREALRFGHNYIGTEHVLLAVLGDDTPSAALLRSFGVDREQAEAWLREQLRR